MDVRGHNSAETWSNDLIFGAKRIYATRGSRWCPHRRAVLRTRFLADILVFSHLVFFGGVRR